VALPARDATAKLDLPATPIATVADLPLLLKAE
jgi:hypothetical protein